MHEGSTILFVVMQNIQTKSTTKISAKDVFEKYIEPKLTGKDSAETITKFCDLDYGYFYNIATKYVLKERQISSLIGFKDEFFVFKVISQIIKELKLEKVYYVKKVTANRNSGLRARIIHFNGRVVPLTLGGDCVVFRQQNNRPVMIIECKEYIDMIRLKEIIGESRLIKDEIFGSKNLLSGVQFCIFAEVLELTPEWSALLDHSDLKYKIDQIFIIRDGKRKDKSNKPIRLNLIKFKTFIIDFLRTTT